MAKTPTREELDQFIRWYYIRRRKKLEAIEKGKRDANDYQVGRITQQHDHWAMKRGFK